MTRPVAILSAEQALKADREAFPHSSPQIQAETVASGASGRLFFRIHTGYESRILMAYPSEPRENQIFVSIGKILHREGIPVPKVLAADEAKGLVWLEDLGVIDLYSFRHDPSRRPGYYRKTLTELARIQELPQELFEEAEIETLPPFDTGLYSFEQRYFADQFAARLESSDPLTPLFREEMDKLTRRLEGGPSKWVHRDFQSKNLMIDPRDNLRVVDFQGIRRGNQFYDLASLLCDPYVNLPATERDELFSRFCEISSLHPATERLSFLSACCQRLMQALGAYGRFGLGEGISFFREQIPMALDLLKCCSREADLPELHRIAERLSQTSLPQ